MTTHAIVSCAHHWIAACDTMRSRLDSAEPYAIAAAVLIVIALLAIRALKED